MPMGRAALCAAFVCLLSACNLSPYVFGSDDDDDAGTGDDAGDIDGGGGIDAPTDGPPPDGCVPFPETCDGADNDCDGNVDEDFDFTQDPAHCGDCTTRCEEPNTAGTCVDSQCEYECLPGFVDPPLNDPSDGCFYFCSPTNGGTEICDLTDNDCDLSTDEGLDLLNDENNCGSCGTVCLALHAAPFCDNGSCSFGACDPGFYDITDAIPGCEYQCAAVGAETCDGTDENCDGQVDELPIAGLGDACADPGFEPQMGVGRCTAGVRACSFGTEVCQGFVRPLADDAICNNIDDDCDNATDEDVNFNDPRHCGSCSPCVLDNAIAACPAGTCTVVDCAQGFVDANGDPADGCEYGCTPTGPETCDGVDNDCDTNTDEGVVAPIGFCETLGECAGTQPSCAFDACAGVTTWRCEYGGAAELDTCGDLQLQEESCDGLDGDCDGAIDETYTSLGDDCHDNGQGICQRTGELICNGTHDGVTCDLTSPVVTPQAETCDNRDENCNGIIDDGAPDEMVQISAAPAVYMYKYEASRPDANALNTGAATARSCSKPGVLPWRGVTKTEAAAACAATGKRLCTETEWTLGCGGAAGLAFPYGDTYAGTKCNGRDVDLDCTAPDSDQLATTGRGYQCPTPGASQCVSPQGAIDMSGNLREWTATPVGSSFRVKGGGYDNIEQGLRCDFSFIAFTPDTAFPNLGFRCCSDTP